MCSSYYFYGLILLLFSTANSHPVLRLVTFVERPDNGRQNFDSFQTTTRSSNVVDPRNVTFSDLSQPQESSTRPSKDTGNATVILVFSLIAMTIVVKTVPVIIAYSLPYFYGPDMKDAETENPDVSIKYGVESSERIEGKESTKENVDLDEMNHVVSLDCINTVDQKEIVIHPSEDDSTEKLSLDSL